jgi:lipid-A-disaccharide synthase
MVRKSFMLIAGETSGDLLAAELVRALRAKVMDIQGRPSDDSQPLHASLEPEFYGAGGPHMAAAGVSISIDMTEHAVVGIWEVIKMYRHFKRVFRQLLDVAIRRQPDAIICVDFAGFNLRFARAVRRYVQSLQGTFANWSPHVIQFVSPQVWASRPERARHLARDVDLVLSILPFEQAWYARNAPRLHVEFVGHPIVDRYARLPAYLNARPADAGSVAPQVLLLPGSRAGELQYHLPVLLETLARLRATLPSLVATMVLPDDRLMQLARRFSLPSDLQHQVGNLSDALAAADIAIASTGTVMLECAYFGVPTVALYKTSPLTFSMAKRLVQVRYLAMPNLLADEEIFPEFIQNAATADNLARAALALLNNPERRHVIRAKLVELVQSLSRPGAADRAAQAILRLVENEPRPLRASLSRPS